jgi:hypothetical protein
MERVSAWVVSTTTACLKKWPRKQLARKQFFEAVGFYTCQLTRSLHLRIQASTCDISHLLPRMRHCGLHRSVLSPPSFPISIHAQKAAPKNEALQQLIPTCSCVLLRHSSQSISYRYRRPRFQQGASSAHHVLAKLEQRSKAAFHNTNGSSSEERDWLSSHPTRWYAQ